MVRSGQYRLLLLLFMLPLVAFNQSHNYWTRSFNEESSLLSGAVVGGGAGPSAIYYNPASISEITESKFSLHASLFSIDIVKVKNALGNGLDLNSTRTTIAPRFLSYMIKPRKHPEWSFEIAILNNENFQMDFNKNVDYITDVLTHIPGEERYYSFFQYRNHYRDDWVGIGGSWNINRSLYLGASMFVMIRSLEYRYTIDVDAYPLNDSIVVDGELIPFFSANYQYEEFLKFNNYRLLWKLGMMYTKNKFSVGIALTTPSVGVFSESKKVSRKLKENNISNPETGESLPGFVIVDYQEGKAVNVNFRSPLSIAAGLTYRINDHQNLYSTVEYFNKINSYNMIEAEENALIGSGSVFEGLDYSRWLTVLSGAKPVLNAAIGYRSRLMDNLMLMTGFRTDFNYREDSNFGKYYEERNIKGLDIDIYHISGGLALTIFGQDLIAGLQYSFGFQHDQKQLINLSDPVEYNFVEEAALQGTRQNTMSSMFNSFSIYFGATFNFGGETK